jgi:hypothetical protein
MKRAIATPDGGRLEDVNSEEEASILAKRAEEVKAMEAVQYIQDRMLFGYPSVGDQLDMMMKDNRDGTTTHQEACEAVKTKYPKP